MNPSVLVVEDYADLRLMIAATLTRSSYACETVATSEAAIVKLRDHQYSAILLSPRLPIGDDPVIHFLAEFQPAELEHLVVMTDGVEMRLPGACRTLCKPFNNDQLMAQVDPGKT